jgi:hypothetical protein
MKKKIRKYRLGNQPKEYELRDNYLGWTPQDEDWEILFLQFVKNTELTIANPVNHDKKTLFLHHFIIKDAFPMEFFVEERTREWSHFAIVSETASSEKFIIPLH